MFRKSVYLLLVLILSACNFPTRQQPLTQETLQASFIQTAAALTAAAPLATPTPEIQPTVAETAVSSQPPVQTGLPVVTVGLNTNCRSGPARMYTLTDWLLVGEQALVVGQNQGLNYWIIQNPRGPGTCWLWGQFATVSGDLSQVPHIEFSAATPGVPVTGQPSLSVTLPTNCRSGPGPQFPILGVLQTGQSAFILGRDAPGIWWLIQHPASIGNCWVWGGYARITGDVAGIPITGPVPIPPTQTPTTVPSAGHFLAVSMNTNCRSGPSPQFPIVNQLRVGQYAPVLARNLNASWWLIQNPNQAGLSCWVWGKYATLWGDFGTIPVIPPTGPTPVATTPVSPTPIPSVTPVPGQAYLLANVNTNCRNAPSPRQPAVGTLLVGQQASIFGRNFLGDWWFVQLPTFPEVQCWVWGQNMVVFGDTSQVAVLPVVGFDIDPGVAEVDPVAPQPQQPLPQVSPAAPIGPEACIVLNQTVTFGQTFSANTPFTATFSVINTGSTTWNPGEVNARYLSGDVVHTVAEVPLAQAVPPGGTIDISVPAIAPATSQSYSALWGITRGAEVLCNLFLIIEVP